MPPLARLAVLVLALPASLVGASSNAGAAAESVVFSPGDATSVQDGRTLCVIGTSRQGKRAITWGGEAAYDALWAGEIAGKHLSGCGFRFTNSSGHGFTVTDQAYVAR